MGVTTGMRSLFAVAFSWCLAGPLAAQPMPVPGDGELPPPPPPPFEASPDPGGVEALGPGAALLGDGGALPQRPMLELPDAMPVPVETTGTWLDRGYWYSEIEAVAMVRQWNRQRLILAGDGDPLFGPSLTIAGFSNSNRSLSLGRSTPGREGSLRATLGRFLFRDQNNTDHLAEFTLFGGGEYGQNSRVDTVGGTGLQVLPGTDLDDPISFDGSESMEIQYDSRFNSLEMNYVIATRLKSDRMELLPSGEWVRRANTGFTYRFLGGLRYVDLTENVAWGATNLAANPVLIPGTNGKYDVRTSNDAFGIQGGVGVRYQAARWSLTTTGKLATMANDLKTRAGLFYTDGATGDVIDAVSSTNSNRTDTISMLGELSVIGRYHLRPNISWRAGYRMMYLTHVALAPHQLDFQPDDARVNSTGDIFYHGLSTGIDFTW